MQDKPVYNFVYKVFFLTFFPFLGRIDLRSLVDVLGHQQQYICHTVAVCLPKCCLIASIKPLRGCTSNIVRGTYVLSTSIYGYRNGPFGSVPFDQLINSHYITYFRKNISIFSILGLFLKIIICLFCYKFEYYSILSKLKNFVKGRCLKINFCAWHIPVSDY